MRIETDTNNTKNVVNNKKIAIEVLIGIVILISIIFIIAKPLQSQAKQAWANISHTKNVLVGKNTGIQILDNKSQSVLYSLNNVKNDNYIEIKLSKNDVYKVEFINDNEMNYIIINTKSYLDDSDTYLYFIPNYITNKGYNRIEISPMDGDGEYWVEVISTHKDPTFDDYKSHVIVDFEIKKLEIQISEKDLLKIAKKREEAVELKILLSEDDDYVPAKFSTEGKQIKGEIRLKGDWTDHLATDKWSYRVKLDNESIWGMKKLSIHSPKARNGIGEYLIHTLYDQYGGVALRYNFIDVIINNEYMGVYAVEENFDKITIESSLRREGPILKLSEDTMWQNRAYYIAKNHSEYESSYVDMFELGKTLENELLCGYAEYAVAGLNRFISGSASASDIFDLELYAKYIAILDVFSSSHGSIWHNMRYYYNPLTAKLEPITFDEEVLYESYEFHPINKDPLIRKLYESEKFVSLYIKSIKDVLQYYDQFIISEKDNINDLAYIYSRDAINILDYEDYLEILMNHHNFLHQTFYNYNDLFIGKIKDDNHVIISIDKEKLVLIELKDIIYEQKRINIDLSSIDLNNIILNTNKIKKGFEFNDISKLTISFVRKDNGEIYYQHVVVDKEN